MKRAFAIIFAPLLALIVAAWAVSAPDPYAMPDALNIVGPTQGNQNTNSKTLGSQSINGGIRNCTIISAGQSNLENEAPTPFTPTNPTKVDNLNPYDGAIYVGLDPLLGPQELKGNPATRIADKLVINNKCDRVILIPVTVGGSSVQTWELSYYPRLLTALARASYRGATVNAIIWGQGETDQTLGTTQASYSASLTSVINRTRTAGYNGPWFIAKQTWNGGSVSANVQAAQVAIVNHGAGIWAGPDADSLNATKRQADNTHFNDTGADDYANLWITALAAFGAPF